MADMLAPASVPSRDRVLNDDELVACWRSAAADNSPFGNIVQLLIATGQRRDEVVGLDWAEISMSQAVWTIPAERSKNGVAHLVPLNDLALAILEGLGGATRRRGLIFSTTGKTPVSGISKFKRRLDAAMLIQMQDAAEPAGLEASEIKLAPWRLHDVRRTVATGLQRLGVRFEVTEAILNHVSGAKSVVAGVYQRHDWKDEKRAALTAWGEHLVRLTGGEQSTNNVVALAGRRAGS
jgi:integrase